MGVFLVLFFCSCYVGLVFGSFDFEVFLARQVASLEISTSFCCFIFQARAATGHILIGRMCETVVLEFESLNGWKFICC